MQPVKRPLLELVREALQSQRGQWRKVSRESGVPYDSLTKVAQGKNGNPGVETLQPLIDYFGIVVMLPGDAERHLQPELEA